MVNLEIDQPTLVPLFHEKPHFLTHGNPKKWIFSVETQNQKAGTITVLSLTRVRGS